MAESKVDKHRMAKEFIKFYCKELTVDDVDWATASDPSPRFNCMGHATGVLRWWQPPLIQGGIVLNPSDYWPENVPHDTSIDSYIKAAKTEGFEICDGPGWDDGYQKITLYFTTDDREFSHATVLISAGNFESKLGKYSDIVHAPHALNGSCYGEGRIYMKRPWPHDSLMAGRLAPINQP